MLALVFFRFSTLVHAQEYEVGGRIQEKVIGGDGKPYADIRADFEVYVRGCGWLIQTTEEDASGKPLRRRSLASTNGAEIYQLVSPASPGNSPNSPPSPGTSASEQTMPLTGKTFKNFGWGTVVSNSVPLGTMNDSIIPHLWVMFASQCYFGNLTTNRLIPIFDVDPSLVGLVDLRLEAEWQLMPSQPSIPLRLVYYNDGGFYRRKDTGIVFTKYSAMYKAGFTNAIYAVTGVKDFGGVLFPVGFTFCEYQPGSGRSRYDLVVRKSAEAIVTKFQPICSRGNLLPANAGPIRVLDQRLTRSPSPTGMLYTIKSGNDWVSVTEAVKRSQRKNNKPTPGSHVAVQAVRVLLLLSGVPMIFMTVKYARQKRSRRQQGGKP